MEWRVSTEGLDVLRPLVDEIRKFDGFGPCLLACGAEVPAVELDLPAADRAARRLIRTHATPTPGVYGMVDAEGELIYVGKSKRLRDRLLSYCSGSREPSKARRIIRRTVRLVWERAPSEFAALVRELELIRRWRPRYNVRGQPRRLRRAYVGLGRGPAPHAYLTARPSKRDDVLFGPIRGGRRFRRAVQLVNDCFQLRDCSGRVPVAFADQLELFDAERAARCLRYDFGTCLGPCAGACSRGEYAGRVHAARDFLRGCDGAVLRELEQAMRAAAAAEQFERAAALRDTWEDLQALREQIARLEETRRRYSFVYRMPGYAGGQTWCLIRHGRVVGATRAPRSRKAAKKCLEVIEPVFAVNGSHVEGQMPEDLDMVHLVGGWFRQNPQELQRVLTPQDARALCRQVGCC